MLEKYIPANLSKVQMCYILRNMLNGVPGELATMHEVNRVIHTYETIGDYYTKSDLRHIFEHDEEKRNYFMSSFGINNEEDGLNVILARMVEADLIIDLKYMLGIDPVFENITEHLSNMDILNLRYIHVQKAWEMQFKTVDITLRKQPQARMIRRSQKIDAQRRQKWRERWTFKLVANKDNAEEINLQENVKTVLLSVHTPVFEFNERTFCKMFIGSEECKAEAIKTINEKFK